MSQKSMFDDNRGADRRDEEDRRKEEVAPEVERRSDDRRQSVERRGWPFGLILRTTESYTVIEEWLEDNTEGEWGFGLEDIDDALAQKSFKVMFEYEADKNKFIGSFSRS